jgi:hypothetical protein
VNESGRIPGAKLLGPLAAIVVLAAVGLYLARARLGGSVLSGPTVSEKVTLSVLRSEAMAFLVARRTATQIVVEHQESDWVGEWRGVLWATVSWRWGVDLSKVQEKDLRRAGQVVYVRLPEPEMLDFAVEPGSIGWMTRATAIPKIMDFARGGEHQRRLQERLGEQARKFAADQRLCPGRQELVRQLNDTMQALGKAIQFE